MVTVALISNLKIEGRKLYWYVKRCTVSL